MGKRHEQVKLLHNYREILDVIFIYFPKEKIHVTFEIFKWQVREVRSRGRLNLLPANAIHNRAHKKPCGHVYGKWSGPGRGPTSSIFGVECTLKNEKNNCARTGHDDHFFHFYNIMMLKRSFL